METFKAEVEDQYTTWEKDIQGFKANKFQMDTQDYQSNKVYKWYHGFGSNRAHRWEAIQLHPIMKKGISEKWQEKGGIP